MSVRSMVARPAGRAVGGALLGLLVTLGLFVATIVAFVLAPLLLLVVAFLAYAVLRPRPDEPAPAGTAGRGPEVASHAFGAGA